MIYNVIKALTNDIDFIFIIVTLSPIHNSRTKFAPLLLVSLFFGAREIVII